ncbi:MAG: NUDIX domain-containing protein [Rhodospirillales bacterium]
MKKVNFSRDDVEVIANTPAYDGFFNLDLYTLRHRQFSGDWGPEIKREVFERGHAVGVLPYDPVADSVVLIEQFRAGAFAAVSSPWFGSESSPWLIETVAGIIDEGELPEDVAYREAMEETGLALKGLLPVCHYLVSPGGSTESVFVYIGHADADKVEGLHGMRHEGEDIRPFAVPLQEAYDAIAAGHINNGMTIICLQWLMLNREHVRTKWL